MTSVELELRRSADGRESADQLEASVSAAIERSFAAVFRFEQTTIVDGAALWARVDPLAAACEAQIRQ